MKHYHLTITSKNKKTLKDFFIFFNGTSINPNLIKKYFQKRNKKKILTILKSPHVNKTAQEQFESRFFINQLTIYSPNIFQSLIFLKKIKVNLFPDIKVKIKFTINNILYKKTQAKIFNPNNFKLNIFNKSLRQKSHKEYLKNKQTQHLLKIFDIYGELLKK